jgi:hypothetical protein
MIRRALREPRRLHTDVAAGPASSMTTEQRIHGATAQHRLKLRTLAKLREHT